MDFYIDVEKGASLLEIFQRKMSPETCSFKCAFSGNFGHDEPRGLGVLHMLSKAGAEKPVFGRFFFKYRRVS